MTAACTWRSSCPLPCTRRPRMWRSASCLSERTACSWPPPPKSRRTPCDSSWTGAGSNSRWTWVGHRSPANLLPPHPVLSSSHCMLAAAFWPVEFHTIICVPLSDCLVKKILTLSLSYNRFHLKANTLMLLVIQVRTENLRYKHRNFSAVNWWSACCRKLRLKPQAEGILRTDSGRVLLQSFLFLAPCLVFGPCESP